MLDKKLENEAKKKKKEQKPISQLGVVASYNDDLQKSFPTWVRKVLHWHLPSSRVPNIF